MPTIPKNSPYFTPVTKPRVEFMRGGASVRVAVDDKKLRQLDGFSDFNGMEKAFALLPEERNGQVKWNKVDLGYEQSLTDRNTGDTVDVHAAYPHVDAEAVRKHGIAVGLETNKGTVWLQNQDDNWKDVAFGPAPDLDPHR